MHTEAFPPIKTSSFVSQTLPSGAVVITLSNHNGQKLALTNYGANILSLWVADRKGVFADLILGYNSLAEYQNDNLCLGSVVGRVAGRISQAKFEIDGEHFTLTKNHGEHHIHGGMILNHRLWEVEIKQETNSVVFSYQSPNNEAGYPGTLHIKITYTLTANNEVNITYWAKTDKKTAVNLTQHAYLNLAGHNNGNIRNHYISIAADHYLPCDNQMIPTGEVRSVLQTPLDLRQKTCIEANINHKALSVTRGFDHYWLCHLDTLTSDLKNTLHKNAEVYEPNSGRKLTLYSDQVGIVLYTGNFIPDDTHGKQGATYHAYSGLCLEPQAPTNAVNTKNFTKIIVSPEKPYLATTRWKFALK